MKKTIYILLALLLFFTEISFSQTYYYKKYTVEDGLAQSQVLTITEDEKGRIWSGTAGGGISIFDGNKFTNITKEDGLPDNTIHKIFIDKKNITWVGTHNGLAKIDEKIITTFGKEQGLTNVEIYSIAQDKNETIWIGTNKGVFTLNNDTITKLIGDDLTENSFIYEIFVDSKNIKWFGTILKGVIRYDNKFTNFNKTNSNLTNNNVRAISEDTEGGIWFGTERGSCYFKNNSINVHQAGQIHTSVTKDKKGFLWFTSYTGWLTSNARTKVNSSKEFKEEQFWCVHIDRENNFWLGSQTGLVKYPPFGIRNYSTRDGIINNNVYALYNSVDSFLCVGTQKGISLLKLKSTGTIKEKINLEGIRSITSISEDKKNIWLGTTTRLARYEKETGTIYSYYKETPEKTFFENTVIDSNLTSPYITHLYKDKKGIIWIGTDKGVTLLQNGKFINFNKRFPNIPAEAVSYITQTKNNDYWFATEENGIYKYSNNKISHYNEKNGLSTLNITAIAEDKQGKIWLASKDGLFVYDGKMFEKLDKRRGLTSNTIYLIQFDLNNNLYIGTNKGIDVLDVSVYNKKGKVIITPYGSKEGFIGQECNRNASCIDHNGELWFGTVKGITGFKPEELSKNKVTPIVSFTNIKIDFADFDWQSYTGNHESGKLLKLPYNKKHLTFDYIATSFTITEKVRYKYKLEGLNDEWSPPVKKIEQDYPILPSGEYTFKVIACNNDGYWSETPAEFSFTIKKPFWETWWFYTVSGLLILIIILAYTKYREAALKKDKIRLEKKVRERTQEVVKQKEIVEQKNKDITDSINYAKNIQEALLPNLSDIEQQLPESMVLYKPKDIVSGDFYWLSQKGDNTFVSAADCTGHGVPGAFMSMLGIAFLDEIVGSDKNLKASEILNKLRENVIVALRQSEEGRSKDGMDMALCKINYKEQKLEFSGANNPLYIIRNNELIEIKGDKMPIGFYLKDDDFNNHEISLQKDDVIYMFSDGYADQFGGPKGKKYKYKKFKNLLMEIHKKSLAEQKEILDKSTTNWRGDISQLDDIIIIGIKFSNL